MGTVAVETTTLPGELVQRIEAELQAELDLATAHRTNHHEPMPADHALAILRLTQALATASRPPR